MESQNGWDEYKKLVLAELERLNGTLEKHTDSDATNFKELRDLINTSVVLIKLEVTSLKSKAGVWGTVAGVITSAAVAIIATFIGL